MCNTKSRTMRPSNEAWIRSSFSVHLHESISFQYTQWEGPPWESYLPIPRLPHFEHPNHRGINGPTSHTKLESSFPGHKTVGQLSDFFCLGGELGWIVTVLLQPRYKEGLTVFGQEVFAIARSKRVHLARHTMLMLEHSIHAGKFPNVHLKWDDFTVAFMATHTIALEASAPVLWPAIGSFGDLQLFVPNSYVYIICL